MLFLSKTKEIKFSSSALTLNFIRKSIYRKGTYVHLWADSWIWSEFLHRKLQYYVPIYTASQLRQQASASASVVLVVEKIEVSTSQYNNRTCWVYGLNAILLVPVWRRNGCSAWSYCRSVTSFNNDTSNTIDHKIVGMPGSCPGHQILKRAKMSLE